MVWFHTHLIHLNPGAFALILQHYLCEWRMIECVNMYFSSFWLIWCYYAETADCGPFVFHSDFIHSARLHCMRPTSIQSSPLPSPNYWTRDIIIKTLVQVILLREDVRSCVRVAFTTTWIIATNPRPTSTGNLGFCTMVWYYTLLRMSSKHYFVPQLCPRPPMKASLIRTNSHSVSII